MLEIVNWNIDENLLWYVRLWADAGGVGVSLHHDQDDAHSGSNAVAQAVSTGYGDAQPVLFSSGVDKFIERYDWHILVAGQSDDDMRVIEVQPFVDLPEISHKIYANDVIAMQRAQAEIDAHTHMEIRNGVGCAVHYNVVDIGQKVAIPSGRAGAVTGTVTEHKISGQPDRLVSSLEITSFMEVTR